MGKSGEISAARFPKQEPVKGSLKIFEEGFFMGLSILNLQPEQ